MATEFIILGTLIVSGYLITCLFRLKSWAAVALGFIFSLSAYTVVAYATIAAEALLSIRLPAIFELIILFLACCVIWKLYNHRSQFSFSTLLITLGLVALIVAITHSHNLARFHSDSLNYMIVGNLIHDGELDAITSYAVESRLSMVPVIHSLANFFGEFYLRSVTPVIGLSLLITFWWLFTEINIKRKFRPLLTTIIGVAGIGLLVTSHSFLFHSFYINGHLMTAAFMLMGGGAAWLLASNKKGRDLLVLLIGTSVVGLTLARPEGFIYAGIITLSLFMSATPTKFEKHIGLLVLGISYLIINVTKLSLLFNLNPSYSPQTLEPQSKRSLVQLIAGILFIAVSRFTAKLPNEAVRWARMSGITLWLILVGLFIYRPSFLLESLGATYQNIAVEVDPWGYSIIALLILLATSSVFFRFKEEIVLRFVTISFIPIAFMLTFITGGTYRVHSADSLNRMIIQFVPLALFYVVVAFAFGTFRYKKPSLKGKN